MTVVITANRFKLYFVAQNGTLRTDEAVAELLQCSRVGHYQVLLRRRPRPLRRRLEPDGGQSHQRLRLERVPQSWQRALHLQLPLLPHKRLFFAQNKKPGLSTQHSKAVFTRRFDLVAANRRHYLRNDLSRCFGKQLKTVAAPDYSDECNCFCWKDAVDIALSELQSMVQQEKSRSDNAWYHNSL